MDTSDFLEPPWDQPLDVELVIKNSPEGETVKGMYCQSAVRMARTHNAALEGVGNYVAFKDYPLGEYMVLLARCGREAFPKVSVREGLRRLGWDVYPTFASSMVGKVILAVGGRDLQRTLDVTGKAYDVSGSIGTASVEHLAPNRTVVSLDEVFSFADSHQVGIFEGVLKAYDLMGTVKVRSFSMSKVDLLLEW